MRYNSICEVIYTIQGIIMKAKNNNKRFKILKNLILICLIYFVASSFYGVFKQIYDYKKQISSLNEQISAENERTNKLKEEKLNMHSDENYKKIARKTLGLVEPGDKVYVNSNDNTDK